MDVLAHDVSAGGEVAAPESVAEDHHTGPAALLFGFAKPSSELRLNPQGIEVFGGNGHGAQPFRTAGSGQTTGPAGKSRNREGIQRFDLLAPTDELSGEKP